MTMDEAMKEYGMNSKERFPSYGRAEQEWREGTTFYADFLVSEACLRDEPQALNDTWDRVWEGWKNNVKYMVELCLCMNHLCWKHAADDNGTLCEWYANKFHFCKERIFSNGSEEEPLPDGCEAFSKEDMDMAFSVLD